MTTIIYNLDPFPLEKFQIAYCITVASAYALIKQINHIFDGVMKKDCYKAYIRSSLFKYLPTVV